MTELLSLDRVAVNAVAATKADAIDLVGRMLVDSGIVTAAYVPAMHQREAIVSTYLGNGIALPHGTNEAHGAILGTGLAVVQVPGGVPWDDEPARLVIGLAASAEDHIEMLSRLATVLEDADLCARLAATADAAEIHAALVAAPPEDGPPGPPPAGLNRVAAITNPSGLHARPAAQIVASLRPLTAEVTIATTDRHADARSITGLLGLGASVGDTVTVVARGQDAEQALAAVMEIVQSGSDR
jgi:multiphosphoryl transfer protein